MRINQDLEDVGDLFIFVIATIGAVLRQVPFFYNIGKRCFVSAVCDTQQVIDRVSDIASQSALDSNLSERAITRPKSADRQGSRRPPVINPVVMPKQMVAAHDAHGGVAHQSFGAAKMVTLTVA